MFFGITCVTYYLIGLALSHPPSFNQSPLIITSCSGWTDDLRVVKEGDYSDLACKAQLLSYPFSQMQTPPL